MEIIQGPLGNWKRLEEAKSTKFLKRLLSFYRPFKHKFSDILNTKPNQRYVRVGCALFTTLLASPEGVKYLGGNKLLFQIAECLAQLDPVSIYIAWAFTRCAKRLLDQWSKSFRSYTLKSEVSRYSELWVLHVARNTEQGS